MEPPRPEQMRRELADMGFVVGLVIAVFVVLTLAMALVTATGVDTSWVVPVRGGPPF